VSCAFSIEGAFGLALQPYALHVMVFPLKQRPMAVPRHRVSTPVSEPGPLFAALPLYSLYCFCARMEIRLICYVFRISVRNIASICEHAG